MSEIFNKCAKWKSIANALGYQEFVEKWQTLRNPTKTLLMFAEVIHKCFRRFQLLCDLFSISLSSLQSLEVPKDTLAKIFEQLGEIRAVECLHEWADRVKITHEILKPC